MPKSRGPGAERISSPSTSGARTGHPEFQADAISAALIMRMEEPSSWFHSIFHGPPYSIRHGSLDMLAMAMENWWPCDVFRSTEPCVHGKQYFTFSEKRSASLLVQYHLGACREVTSYGVGFLQRSATPRYVLCSPRHESQLTPPPLRLMTCAIRS
jgi:hypothetical protein